MTNQRKEDFNINKQKVKFSIFKKIDLARNIITILLYMAYVTYSIMSKKGNEIINLILIIVALTYLIFFIFTVYLDYQIKLEKKLASKDKIINKKETKKIKKAGKKTYKNVKKILLFINACLTITAIINAGVVVNPIAIIMACLTIIGFIIHLLILIISAIIKTKVKKIINNKFAFAFNKTTSNNEDLPEDENFAENSDEQTIAENEKDNRLSSGLENVKNIIINGVSLINNISSGINKNKKVKTIQEKNISKSGKKLKRENEISADEFFED